MNTPPVHDSENLKSKGINETQGLNGRGEEDVAGG